MNWLSYREGNGAIQKAGGPLHYRKTKNQVKFQRADSNKKYRPPPLIASCARLNDALKQKQNIHEKLNFVKLNFR